MSDDQIKHLELTEGVIARMASHSFLLEGWSVTIATALFALAVNQSKSSLVLLALFPVFSFWGLDAFYLRSERLYRRLYDDICAPPGHSHKPQSFSLSTKPYKKAVPSWFRTLWSPAVVGFHGVVVLSLLALILALHADQIRRIF